MLVNNSNHYFQQAAFIVYSSITFISSFQSVSTRVRPKKKKWWLCHLQTISHFVSALFKCLFLGDFSVAVPHSLPRYKLEFSKGSFYQKIPLATVKNSTADSSLTIPLVLF